MNYLDWHVGMKVVCVRVQESERAADEGVLLPKVGRVYTIRDMEPADGFPGICIRLVELVNAPHVEDGIEPSFWSRWFRPVQTRKTSISIFKAMLHDRHEKVPA